VIAKTTYGWKSDTKQLKRGSFTFCYSMQQILWHSVKTAGMCHGNYCFVRLSEIDSLCV